MEHEYMMIYDDIYIYMDNKAFYYSDICIYIYT